MGNYFKMNKVRDDTLSIDLPNSGLVFTRYLYIKDEVKIALLISILNKNDDAIFWAYELYHSGFKVELLNFIWKIYYEFFATLNPSFEAYLLNKTPDLALNDDKLVSAIIQDLIIRPFNTDVFFLRMICNTFEIECKYKDVKNPYIYSTSGLLEQLTLWIDACDYKSISQFILNEKKKNDIRFSNEYIYSYAINAFELIGLKVAKKRLLKEFKSGEQSDIVLLVKILTLFSIKEKLVKGKNFYITINPEDIVQYETIEAVGFSDIRHYRVLSHACICGIDDLKHLSLFKLEREKFTQEEFQNIYNNKWLYHASFAPIWFDRIKKYKGYVNYIKQDVEFLDEDLMQMFYKKYGYEPDEQPKNVKDKSIMAIVRETDWSTFYHKHNNNRLFLMEADELEELNMDKIKF